MAAITSHCALRSDCAPFSSSSSSFSGQTFRQPAPFPGISLSSPAISPTLRRRISCQTSSAISPSSAVNVKGQCSSQVFSDHSFIYIYIYIYIISSKPTFSNRAFSSSFAEFGHFLELLRN